MVRQKSDTFIVPKAERKPGSSAAFEGRRIGKGRTRLQVPQQIGLCFESAEYAQAAEDNPPPARRVRPPSKHKVRTVVDATMEEVVKRLDVAMDNVARNNGAAGPDRKTVDEVMIRASEITPHLQRCLLDGTYNPGEIRRVWIPKAGGGERGLGIPNVIDRVVQEAVRLVLEPIYEQKFHPSSHGFRPNRSCHTAIEEAKQYLDDGYAWVVDIDLEKFFDRVHHQRLMARLALKVTDRRLLILIGKMLKARTTMPDGVKVQNDEGVPQGGPLSPLLSNIVLDELDKELATRGHRFVRYADDCNIYVRSEQAGHRVMASIKSFIERRLRLKVNEVKSAVARPETRHFLGFSLRRDPLEGDVQVGLSKRSKERMAEKVQMLTPSNWGNSLATCIGKINQVFAGWIGFFGICTKTVEHTLRNYDAHVRRRLRGIMISQWKTRRTAYREVRKRGLSAKSAKKLYDGRKSRWALTRAGAVEKALSNAFFLKLGLVPLVHLWNTMQANIAARNMQLTLGFG